MRRIGLAIGTALVVLAVSVPVVSAAANREVTLKRDVATLLFDDNAFCLDQGYDFLVTGEYLRVRTDTLWFDESGALVKQVRIIQFKGREWNSDDPSKYLDVHGTRRLEFDFVAGTITETGSNFHITLPGQGVILLQSGRMVVDLSFSEILSMSGPHDAMTGNYAEYCAAIA